MCLSRLFVVAVILIIPVTALSQTITPGNPGASLQGGDNISDASPISQIPFWDSGTTYGYTDDYEGTCGTDGVAPDVVYSFTPTYDMSFMISLCQDSNFDTRLYVFEDSPANVIACNDDECSNQYTTFVSQLNCVQMFFGHTYYIVVDGYSGASGEYSIYISLPVPGPSISGGVLTTGGDPISGADIWVLDIGGQPVWHDTTNGQGYYSVLQSLEGLYSVEAAKAGYITQIQGPVNVLSCDPAFVDFFLEPSPPPPIGSIAGFVTDGDSARPLEGAIMRAIAYEQEMFRDTSDVNGYYIMPEMQLGSYTLEASHPDFVTHTEYGVEVFMDQLTAVDFLLYRPCDYVGGDVNNSGVFNGIDVTYAVSYFKGGPPPPYSCFCHNYVWYVAGDFNGDCQFNGLDITRIVGYLKGFWQPGWCPDCPPRSGKLHDKL